MSNNNKEIFSPKEKNEEAIVALGHGNFVVAKRIVGVCGASGLAMKRLRDCAEKRHLLVDATVGRRTRAVVVLDSGHVFLSSLGPQTIQERLLLRPSTSSIELTDGEFLS